MANEIRITGNVTVKNPVAPATGQVPQQENIPLNVGITQAAQGSSCGIMTVPTTAGGTVLPVGSVTTQGYLVLANLDITNYVQFGPTSGGAIVVCGKLKPGEIAVLRLDSSVTLRLLANTASVKVQHWLLQD